VKRRLIGTTRRTDGRLQVTYGGHPVYFYEGDTRPGQVLCQAVYEFGGFWYVLRASGKPFASPGRVRSAATLDSRRSSSSRP
jgi:Secreted repeat of unknown function